MSLGNKQSSYSSSLPSHRYGMPRHEEESSQVSANTGATQKVQSFFERCFSPICLVPVVLYAKLRERVLLPVSRCLLTSSIWRAWLVIGNFILLFGNPIQNLILPPSADKAVDVLYTLVFITFMLDMMLRATAVAGYCTITAGRIDKPSRNWLIYCGQWISSVRFPSFLFACDLFSTLTLLYDISFITPENFEIRQLEFDLSEVFIPVSVALASYFSVCVGK